jgi:hypothetical protein
MVAAGLMSAILPLGLGAIVMSVRLRVSGMDLQTILRNVLLQPRWWRTWYPRALRRPGDVWSRLPREIRRFRSVRGVGKAYVFGVLMPLFAMPVTRHLLVLQVVLWSMWVVCVSMIWTTHNRATKVIRARTGVTANEASSILNTPTWRASAWRREPAAALLRDGSLRPGPKASAAEPVGLGPAVAADRSTRVS